MKSGVSFFIEKGFKVVKKTKVNENKSYYSITSPTLGSFDVDSLNELTKEKYENLVKIIG